MKKIQVELIELRETAVISDEQRMTPIINQTERLIFNEMGELLYIVPQPQQ